MEIAIRELDYSELDLVAGGGLGWSLIKIGAALIGTLAGGPIGGATGAALSHLVEAAVSEPPQPWVDTGWTD